DLVERDFPRVEENIVRKEVRKDREAAGRLDSERRGPGDGFGLDEEVAFLQAEPRGIPALPSDFDRRRRPPALDQRDALDGGPHEEARPEHGLAQAERIELEAGALLPDHR